MSSMVTRLVIVAVIVWLVIIIVMSGPFLRPGGLPEDQVRLLNVRDSNDNDIYFIFNLIVLVDK